MQSKSTGHPHRKLTLREIQLKYYNWWNQANGRVNKEASHRDHQNHAYGYVLIFFYFLVMIIFKEMQPYVLHTEYTEYVVKGWILIVEMRIRCAWKDMPIEKNNFLKRISDFM